jgi:hypothetical protein
VLWLAGLLLLGVATWQAGVLPRWTGVLWFGGALLYVTGVPSGPEDAPRITALMGAFVMAAGFGWAGVSMLSLE